MLPGLSSPHCFVGSDRTFCRCKGRVFSWEVVFSPEVGRSEKFEELLVHINLVIARRNDEATARVPVLLAVATLRSQ